MHYFLYPTKDAFITNNPDFLFKNTGLDEILEVEKTLQVGAQGSVSGSKGTVLSRALMYFDLSQISSSLADSGITDVKYTLKMKVSEANQIPLYYTLAAYPLASTWGMGTGYLYDGSTVADGASWKYSDGSSLTWWIGEDTSNFDGGGIWFTSPSGTLGSGSGYAEPAFVSPNPYNPFPYCPGIPTASVSSSNATPVSGAFQCSQTFKYQTSDVNMDVTPIVNTWLSGSLPNFGFILLHSGEMDSIDYGKLRFFSKETNTIYSPTLDISWNDATFNTGSADPVPLKNAVVTIQNMMSQYKTGTIIDFSVLARNRYVVKTFTNKLTDYLEPYYLPYNSFYSIKDAESLVTLIPFDEATRLSFDESRGGNYFILDTTGLPQERYFKVSIRCHDQNGAISIFDIPTTFKITR
jgi:hypothetical protein